MDIFYPYHQSPSTVTSHGNVPQRAPIRKIWFALLVTWTSTLGVATAFAVYIFKNRLLVTHSGIYTSVPIGRLLLISNIASRSAIFTGPLFMSLLAYALAAKWMKASQEENGVRQNRKILLLPEEYTAVVSMISKSSIFSLIKTLRSLTNPLGLRSSLVHGALSTLGILLILAHSLSIVESVWLHEVATSIVLPIATPQVANQNRNLSRITDDFCQSNPVYTDCDGEQVLPCSLRYLGNSCADAQGAVDVLRGSDEAISTANNISTSNLVALTPDSFTLPSSSDSDSTFASTAILLPFLSEGDSSKLNYEATTTGVRTTCHNLTPQCNITVAQPDDSPETGSVLYSHCNGKPGLTQGLNDNRALGPEAGWNITVFDTNGVKIFGRGQPNNTFAVAMAMIWNVDLGANTSNTTPTLLGGMLHTRGPRLFGLLWCDVEVLSPVRYLNDRGLITVLDAPLARPNSSEVWSISGSFGASKLSAKLYTDGQASVLNPASSRSISVTSQYSRALSRILLSTAAGIHTSSASVQESVVTLVQAAYIPWSVLGVFFALVLMYATFVGWIAVKVWMKSKVESEVGGLDVVHNRLSEPGSAIFDLVARSPAEATGSGGDDIKDDTRKTLDQSPSSITRLRLSKNRTGGIVIISLDDKIAARN